MSEAAQRQLEEKAKVHVLAIGITLADGALFGTLAGQCLVTRLPCDMEKALSSLDPCPQLILCGLPSETVDPTELAQALRMQCPRAPIYALCLDRKGYDRKILMKNGFTDAFLLPMDADFLRSKLVDEISKLSSNALKSYRSVKLIDIQPGSLLDFDTTIYLPANNKYIRYSAAGDPLDEDQVTRLQKHKMSALYVSSDQMPKFYEYTARHLKELGDSTSLSATEKRERLEGSIRELMTGIFNDSNKDASFEQGKALVRDCQEIVKNYVTGTKHGEWYKRLLSAVGELGNSYSHPANVSTYASLFSMGLQIGEPAELAMAGLLHDIGMADIPQEIALKPESERTPEEQAVYEKHPQLSVDIIKSKRLVIPEKVFKMILQHHECFNGSGFPEKLTGSRILKEAQILALADRFDELTVASQGRPLMTPVEAIRYLKEQISADPAKMIYDPELLRQVLNLFPQD